MSRIARCAHGRVMSHDPHDQVFEINTQFQINWYAVPEYAENWVPGLSKTLAFFLMYRPIYGRKQLSDSDSGADAVERQGYVPMADLTLCFTAA